MAGALATEKKPRKSLFAWRRPPLMNLRDDVEDLMSHFWEGDMGWLGGGLIPSADVSETDKTVEVRMDIPGMKAADIDIRLNHNVLTVRGERREEKEEKSRTFHRAERRWGTFSRSFTLPCEVVEDKVAAEYHDGTLCITLPKCEEAQTRKIAVKG